MGENKKPWYEYIKEKMKLLDERSRTVEKQVKDQGENIAYMRGELDEMKRHNSKLVKILVAIIGAMALIICALIQYFGMIT